MELYERSEQNLLKFKILLSLIKFKRPWSYIYDLSGDLLMATPSQCLWQLPVTDFNNIYLS